MFNSRGDPMPQESQRYLHPPRLPRQRGRGGVPIIPLHMYKLIAAGALRSVKVGGRRLIPADALEALLAGNDGDAPSTFRAAGTPATNARGLEARSSSGAISAREWARASCATVRRIELRKRRPDAPLPARRLPVRRGAALRRDERIGSRRAPCPHSNPPPNPTICNATCSTSSANG